ncbi:DUF4175 family protein [Aestuariibaculum sediminum]|uniref:DUF4175 family protein n=1 Tax=Aestuariibaculum sediminum TaxID=2770637 RepID=A0A8J6Q5Y2_9FLAO|nr:DUF4175 family protein [Aestuariibaculum sediminum]MBD0831243.1 hypothetical protein [Aestuariibaculum sediminum]
MTNFNNILRKLEAFIKRYYYNELLKGAILFFSIGFLYFLLTLFIEYALWLPTHIRTLLFWLFICVEVGLLLKFLVWPLAKLFKIQKGINYEQASRIIGKHFPEVNDKLLNVLQLHRSDNKNELLLASIEQKSVELSPVPFKLAINLNTNIKYVKYAAIPVVLLLLIFISGKADVFGESYQRVMDYKTAYERPAPFKFFVVNEHLNAVEDDNFKLEVRTTGDVIPENVEIVFNDESYYLQQKGSGAFEYVFLSPKESIEFQLTSNNVTSKPYRLNVVKVPSLLDFQMHLNYPSYTKKQNEILKSTGNAIVPEGTKIEWRLNTKSTEEVTLIANDTVLFKRDNSVFYTNREVRRSLNYTISTSNEHLKNYESLGFSINVVKDAFPELNVTKKMDSLDLQTLYFYGQVSDDYGLRDLQLIYYPVDNPQLVSKVNIDIKKSNFDEFISAFPNDLEIKEGMAYELFFEATDNDAINNYKSVKSEVFSYRKRTEKEETEKRLNEQKETIHDLNKSLESFEEQEKQLEQLSNTQKEKESLSFNDKRKIESFFERQKQQDEMMKLFNKKLKENIQKIPNNENDSFKEDLEKRLEENEQKLKQDEKLLEELEKFKDKITKEQLAKQLDELAKQNKNKKRSLEQLVELTKRFYVQQKLDRLQQDLMKQAINQDKLSNQNKDENTKEKQEDLNKGFEKLTEELNELKKENKQLKKPLDVPQDKLEEMDIKEEQHKALDGLEKLEENKPGDKNGNENQTKEGGLNDVKNSQKRAAQKMKKYAESMQMSMQGSSGDQLQEDVEMLRQILDNLVLFSFDEEALMNQFKGIEDGHSKYANYLKTQNNLKEHFEHVDDSLFALSLRQPKLSEQVNKEITEVYYNIDKALNSLSEGQLYQGISSQQFTITAANNLANLLSTILDNMEEQLNMSASSNGQGDMQLQDIIMSQEELNKMMEEGMKKGEEGEPKQEESEGQKEGQKDNKGKEKSGQEGNDSKDGEGNNEDLNGLLYEIYQKQQELRNALEERISNQGSNSNTDRLTRSMEQIELDLLNKGFNQQTLQRMTNLKHQLLKLEKAEFEQGEDNKRKSDTNLSQFKNSTSNQLPNAKQYFNTTEILNKQTLPLQPDYKKKVKVYFKQQDD